MKNVGNISPIKQKTKPQYDLSVLKDKSQLTSKSWQILNINLSLRTEANSICYYTSERIVHITT